MNLPLKLGYRLIISLSVGKRTKSAGDQIFLFPLYIYIYIYIYIYNTFNLANIFLDLYQGILPTWCRGPWAEGHK